VPRLARQLGDEDTISFRAQIHQDPDAIGMDRGGAAPGQERQDAAAVRRLARPVSAINEAMTPA